jgi:hypothetical protein
MGSRRPNPSGTPEKATTSWPTPRCSAARAPTCSPTPSATLFIIDPADSSCWIEIRADVDLSTRDTEQQLDALTRTYTRHTHYYGQIYPLDQRNLETRVIARLHPRDIHCDAIHR